MSPHPCARNDNIQIGQDVWGSKLSVKLVELEAQDHECEQHNITMDGPPESTTRATRLFSYNIYVYKKPDMDDASHHDHVQKINTPIIKALLEKYGAVAYTVVCLPFAPAEKPLEEVWPHN